MKDFFDYFINEDSYQDFDSAGAVERLSKAITFKTVTSSPAEGAFEGLHAHIKASYPNLMKASTFETFRNSVLITLPGSDSALDPVLYMSHQDVVPVVPGTEDDWTYDAFSGTVADGYIWGRGTEDIKEQVFGSLEAIEYLLSKGFTPKRTVYFAFGDDEETFNEGSRMMAEELQRRGVHLEYLLDEGGGKLYDAECFGAPGLTVSNINLMEKGYADLELSVESKGGHSSRPFGGTSLGILSNAIASICNNPFPIEVNPLLKDAFAILSPEISTEPLKSLVCCDDPDWDTVASFCYSDKSLFPFSTTTIAPTMIGGSSMTPNVMPQNMSAVINFRLNYGNTPEKVLEHCRACVNDERVSMRFLQSNPPSKISDSKGLGFTTLVNILGDFYKDIKFIPMLTAGASDARNYEIITDSALRYSPFLIPEEDHAGVHGTNERILIRSYIHGIKILIALMSTN